MTALATETKYASTNPLDVMEEIVTANQWCDYRLHLAWSNDLSALHFSCALDIRVPQARHSAVHEVVGMINPKIWVGHFEVAQDDRMPIFRHTLLLRGANGATVEQLEDLLDVAIAECERFYPTFQFVIWGGKRPEEALQAALLETVGEA
jgi:hypothetical protein